MRLRDWFLYLFCSLSCFSVGQDTLKQLPAVEIETGRVGQISTGLKTEKVDSARFAEQEHSDLTSLLSRQSLVFIKNYGPGTLASTSLRGAGAGHTAVLWNGFSLVSPMNGMIDLSLVPVFLMDNISVQYGSASAMWGSGAVGGTILLGNEPDFNRGLELTAGAGLGSFSRERLQAGISYSNDKLASSVKFFQVSAINNFLFPNIARKDKPVEQQTNAGIQQYGIMQENDFRLGRRNKLNTRFWYQYNDRQIPPSMTQKISNATQKDKALRFSSEFQHTREQVIFLTRAAFIHEDLRFHDPAIDLDAISNSDMIITEAEMRTGFIKTDLLHIGVNNTFSAASTKEYPDGATENQTAVFAGYSVRFLNDRLITSLNVRQAFLPGKYIPLAPSLGIEGRIFRMFFLSLNGARHYRLPTFNDRYFIGQGGIGNPDLAPESGWNAEGTLAHRFSHKQFSWSLSATAFNRDISNWILWQPVGPMFWKPENVLKVWSRGVEYDAAVKMNFNKMVAGFSVKYNYVRSTNEFTGNPNDPVLQKQLIYTPIQNAVANLFLTVFGCTISYSHSYTGYRFTSSDNRQFLKPYMLGSLHVSGKISVRDHAVRVFADFNNIFNENYQVYAYRAMPLLNMEGGITLYINANKKSKK